MPTHPDTDPRSARRRRVRPAAAPQWLGGVWIQVAVQVALVVGAFFVYFGVRGLTEGSVAIAEQNAERLVAAERALGIWWEPALQGLITDHPRLVTLANWVYIWGHWPLIALAAAWLFVSDRTGFALLRNAMFAAGAIGLVIFATFPVAPPRLMELGLLDTITDGSRAYRTLQPPALVNQYAAFPSLHFGFNLLVGVVIAMRFRRRAVQVLAIAMPMAMAAAVVLTGNHYVIDVPAGAAVALAGLAVVVWGPRALDRVRRGAGGIPSRRWSPNGLRNAVHRPPGRC